MEKLTEMDIYDKYRNKRRFRYVAVTFGAIFYALGISLFITPAGLYSGGVMGLSQLLRTVLIDYFGLFTNTSIDIAGVFYYILNIPLLILCFTKLSKSFFAKTLLSTTVITIAVSFFSLDGVKIIDDVLTSSVIGGIISGIGVGIMLRFGGSGGGSDILGVYFAQKYTGASVGKVTLAFNAVIYICCAILYTPAIAIYSIIFSVVCSQAMDKTHHQNIMMQAMIFTKVDNIAEPLMQELNRGVTKWEGAGAYTHETTHILCVAFSKYELATLKKLVHKLDPNAFMIFNELHGISGNFKKKLS